jgi:Tfp pilus assembly protein PilF
MTINLLDLDKRAMTALGDGDYAAAIPAFMELIAAQPDYEHGLPHYHLAHALEDIRDYEMARKEYEAALQWAPGDTLRLGAYASFLYLHGAPTEAIDAYLRLARSEKASDPEADISDIIEALSCLAVKAGLDRSEVLNRL